MRRVTVGDLLGLVRDVDIDTQVFLDVPGYAIHPLRGVLVSVGEHKSLILTGQDIDSATNPQTVKGDE